MKMRLKVFLSDGRELSGVYHWAAALARLDFARTLPTFKSFSLVRP